MIKHLTLVFSTLFISLTLTDHLFAGINGNSNPPQVLTAPVNPTYCLGQSTAPVTFGVKDPDGDALSFTITSSNTTLIANNTVSIEQIGANAYRALYAVTAGQTGFSNLSVVVSDTYSNQITITIKVTVNPLPTVAVTLSPNQTTVCAGTTVVFTANPSNASSPAYQWKKNGTDISGATNNTYSTNVIAQGDAFSVVMTTTACPATSTYNSNTVTMSVSATSATVTIATPQTAVCSGIPVTFTATPSANAVSPTYQWRKNGTNISGATVNPYTTSSLANGDVIDVIMSYSGGCSPTANSNTIGMTVTPTVVPAITAKSNVTTICTASGSGIELSILSSANAGPAPGYQWRKNGVNISGANADSYSTTAVVNGDKFDLVMTSSAACASPVTVTSAQITITVNAAVAPSVTITDPNPVCAGANVTFEATPGNGGTAPTYQWRKNSAPISGATGDTYTSSSLVNGDKIDVVMTSNLACATTPTATSAQRTMVVNPMVTPAVTITGPSAAVCAGTLVTFSINASTGGGTTPTYQWRKNGTNISGATGVTYSSTAFVNGDLLDVVMTSNAACLSQPTGTSAAATLNINPMVTPLVTIASDVNLSNTVCAGTSIKFTAFPMYGGTAPAYQWRKNGTNISGAIADTYTSAAFANNDKIDVVITSNAACRTQNNATSAQTTLTITPVVAASVTISVPQTLVCSGAPVMFSVSNTTGEGTSPQYQWRKNGTDINGATGNTFTTSSIATSDVFSVRMTSNAACVTGSPVLSNNLTMTTTTSVTASVTVAADPAGPVYQGKSVTFTATPVNGGSSPSYQWKNNGVNISGATGASYTSTSLANGNVISVQMTSNAPCVATATVNSTNSITMTINPNPAFSTSISGPASVTASQTNVTYSVTDKSANGMTYFWTAPPGATIISGQGTNTITINFGTSGGSVNLTETNGAGQNNTISLPVTVTGTTPVQLADHQNGAVIYPVPCSSSLFIQLPVSTTTELEYTIIDATGKSISAGTILYNGAPVELETRFSQGIYQILIRHGDYTSVRRFVKEL